MSVRRPAPAPGAVVFKPKESMTKFGNFFPKLYAIFGCVFLVALAGGYFLSSRFHNGTFWLMPIMTGFPIGSMVLTGIYVGRVSKRKIVIDGDRIRMIEGAQVKTNLQWHQITRLTIRRERDADLYELWVKNQPLAVHAAFFQDGDKLLQAISARTSLAWERVKA
ncbi:MAG TPA: hypothetical protein V6D47_03040 [Oscillatoriaceae cyanobacterium]